MEHKDTKTIIDLSKVRRGGNEEGFQDRITARLDVYWQTFGEDPVGKTVLSEIMLGTSEVEPYIRKKRVTEKPTELTYGDLDQSQVGYILLVNTEGTKLLKNPSPEERRDIKKRIVTVNGFEIHPHGTPFFGRVPSNEPVIIRCLHGSAVIQAYIFPR